MAVISETTPSAPVDQGFDTRLFGAHFDQCKRLEALIEPPGFTGKAPGPEISWRMMTGHARFRVVLVP
jgi:hypothetical protein